MRLSILISGVILLASMISSCASVGDAWKSTANPGYNWEYVQISDDCADPISRLEEALQEIAFDTEEKTASSLVTKYRSGPCRVKGGGFFGALDDIGSAGSEIRIICKEDPDKEKKPGTTRYKLETATRDPNRYSSPERSQQKPPSWVSWERDWKWILKEFDSRCNGTS